MISFKEISKSFRNDFWSPRFYALEKVTFHIPAGKVTGFLGANGAGKTTLMKILMGLSRPDEGEVQFHPRLGGSFKDIRAQIGYLPERPFFYPHLSGQEFIHYLGELSNVPRDLLEKNLSAWAQVLSLDFALKRKIRTYSKGMLQRLGLISAVIHDPQLIILDEPLSGLDPLGRKEIKEVIGDLHRKGKTVFFSSHVIPDVEEVCQEVVFLEKGKLIFQGGIQELIHKNPNPHYAVRAQLPRGMELKTPCHRVGKAPAGGMLSLLVEEKYKEELVREILQGQGVLEFVGLDKRGLEEVLYKNKGDDAH